MKRIFSGKKIVIVLSICILLISVGMALKAVDDPAATLKAIKKKCTAYCSKYTNGYTNMACFEGCVAGSMVPLT